MTRHQVQQKTGLTVGQWIAVGGLLLTLLGFEASRIDKSSANAADMQDIKTRVHILERAQRENRDDHRIITEKLDRIIEKLIK